MPHGQVLRSHYVVLICSSLISAQDTNLNPVEFCWNSVDSIINTTILLHYQRCKRKKAAKKPKKTAIEDVSAVNLALHASVTEKKVIPKFTNKLS